MDLRSTYNRIAEDWFRDHSDDDWWVEGTNKFLEFLPKGSTILDVGCGAGHKTRYLKNKGFDARGIDFSEKMIDIAKRESKDIDFEVFNIYKIDNYSLKFDGIFIQAVLLHIPKKDVVDVLRRVKSKINPNGLLYIAVKGSKENSPLEEIKKEDDYGYEYERFFSYYGMKELESYFNELGMEVLYKTSKVNGRTEWLQIIGRSK